jgi:hypothetical protein
MTNLKILRYNGKVITSPVFKHHVMKTYEGKDVKVHTLLTLTLGGE